MTINYKERIESNPAVMLGKPCIKGTRLTVEYIVQLLSEGISAMDIQSSIHSEIALEDVFACLSYAKMHLAGAEITNVVNEPIISYTSKNTLPITIRTKYQIDTSHIVSFKVPDSIPSGEYDIELQLFQANNRYDLPIEYATGGGDFMALSGIWKDLDIDQVKLRELAWKR